MPILGKNIYFKKSGKKLFDALGAFGKTFRLQRKGRKETMGCNGFYY